MTPSAIIALVRDALIIGALVFIVWWIRTDGKNSVKVADMQAVQKQLASNAAQEAAWASQRQAAETQRAQDTQTITAAIGAHTQPVIVRVAPNPGAVPSTSAQTTSSSPASRTTDNGSQFDIRPAVNAFALKYETALADCRTALSQWP